MLADTTVTEIDSSSTDTSEDIRRFHAATSKSSTEPATVIRTRTTYAIWAPGSIGGGGLGLGDRGGGGGGGDVGGEGGIDGGKYLQTRSAESCRFVPKTGSGHS